MRPLEGGRHPAWGTANRIVPLGDSYVELVAVVDEQQAGSSAFGSWIARGATRAGRPLGWCVRPDDLGATASRLDLRIDEGSRTKPSGERLEWRSAGIDEAVATPGVPFFIEWGDATAFPGSAAEPAAAITRIELACDAGRLAEWLGPHDLPIAVDPGTEGVTAVVLEGPRGRVTLHAERGR